jgi:futalosine hydrolase
LLSPSINIGLIASDYSEGKQFGSILERTGNPSSEYPALYSGTIAGARVIFAVSGIGKTNAAHAATILIERYSPHCLVNFGIGGAYPSSGLQVGDIAVAEREVYADEGVLLNDGLHSLQITGIPLLKIGRRRYFNEFPADKRLARIATKASGTVAHCGSGVFLTVSSCTGTAERAGELEARFNPVCENMEGAAIAHICCLYRVSFVEIRGISNIVEDRDLSGWDIRLAAENSQNAVRKFIEMFSRKPAFNLKNQRS